MSQPYDEKLKHQFLIAVARLMKEAPEDVQKQWDGNVVWKMNQPYLSPNNVQFKFRDKLHDDFNSYLCG